MREIILDTETTGLDPETGHKLAEIGCVELLNMVPTGKVYHQYINPGRAMPAEASAVHGLTDAFLKDKPLFSEIFTDFIEFIGQDTLVIHNASFDMKFINYELKQVGFPAIPPKRVVDTLRLAREKFPGSPASLDALCRRFSIDNSSREFHGALLDAQLLSEVYLELMGGRQHGLGLAKKAETANESVELVSVQAGREKTFREPRPHAANDEEIAAHAAMVAGIKDAIWKNQK